MHNPFLKATLSPLSIFILLIAFLIISCSKKDEFCPVIDDLREIDAVKVVNTFDDSKIAYFVDLHNGYQILVKKDQVEQAYSVLSSIGIENQSALQTSCKIVH